MRHGGALAATRTKVATRYVYLTPGRDRIPRRNRAQPSLPERYIRATRRRKMEG
jgi:hypothetical protein